MTDLILTNTFIASINKKASILLLLFCCLSFCGLAQSTPTVKSSVDSTSIKIGEQIHFTFEVEADTASQVIFPEGQTFMPLEVVEALPTDTIVNQDKFNLIKKYALTQFDSGSYTLPRQQVMINNKPYFTDSLKIEVNTVVVDTTKQKMYDIKALAEVEKPMGDWWKWLLGGLLVAALVGGLLYWFVFRKKPLTEEEKIALLPPYDRALAELKRLDESKYLIQSEYKEYYSELTNIVRSYLEEDVHISALESTTDELITKMEMLRDSGSLKIDDDTIKQFKNVLQTADLVKFAKSTPENSVIDRDRKTIEQIVVKTKEALPEPTEEELMEQEEYVEEFKRKKRHQQIKYAIAAGVAVLVITAGVFTYKYGFSSVKDSVFGHPTKTLLENEWIGSSYGFPAIYLETPEVLKRDEEIASNEMTGTSSHQEFSYGELGSNFYIKTSISTYNKEADFDAKKAIDAALEQVEKAGAKNMIVKQEDLTTPTGKEGNKVFGTLEIENPETNKVREEAYVILSFVQNGGFQQVIMVYEQDDRYAKEIVERVTNSIDFKTES
ncbi:BatD family protein [Galbibacter mesophilus]|uniref:BatD family protein n=1 Tax=Galbibacter mesophilus TaxID=379069 RepID=UPI00191DD003|nr:BatD family protein [Galbibacter mesophilus]MCM5662090.1 BatD family protein [Galbibacter mesophilus]